METLAYPKMRGPMLSLILTSWIRIVLGDQGLRVAKKVMR